MKFLATQRSLFFALMALLLVHPLLGDFLGSRLLFYATFILVMVAGPLAVAEIPRQRALAVTAAVLMLAPGIASLFFVDNILISVASSFFGLVFFAYLALLLSKTLLFRIETVDNETLWGAVNVYLCFGIAFASMYALTANFVPDAFVGKFLDAEPGQQIEAFIYFSFVTMTTLGYGDLAPNNPFVGTLAFLEAILGQLYVAIMIARLVGMHISSPR